MEENEYYGAPQSKALRVVKRIISTTVVMLIFIFIGALILRIMFSDYYPRSMKAFHFTDELSAHYNEDPDTFAAYCLDMDTPYIPDYDSDGKSLGNFFAAGVTLVPDSGSVQLFVRFNRATLATLNEEYGLSLTEENSDTAFVFSLFASHGADADGMGFVGADYTPVYEESDKLWIYNYRKLCYEGVDIDSARWLRLEITLSDTGELIGTIPVYIADSDFDDLEKISFKKSELPK